MDSLLSLLQWLLQQAGSAVENVLSSSKQAHNQPLQLALLRDSGAMGSDGGREGSEDASASRSGSHHNDSNDSLDKKGDEDAGRLRGYTLKDPSGGLERQLFPTHPAIGVDLNASAVVDDTLRQSQAPNGKVAVGAGAFRPWTENGGSNGPQAEQQVQVPLQWPNLSLSFSAL